MTDAIAVADLEHELAAAQFVTEQYLACMSGWRDGRHLRPPGGSDVRRLCAALNKESPR